MIKRKSECKVIVLKKALIFLTLVLVAALFVSCVKTITVPEANAVLSFKYNGNDIVVELSAEESETIRTIFNNKRPYQDNPSCGFTENVSIRFDDSVFCIACDNCSTIKFQGQFFSISDDERETINQIFEIHGGFFPCA